MITPYFSSSGEYAELILNVCHVSQLSTSFFGCLLWLSEFFGQESTIVGEYLEVEISPPPLPNCERNALVGSASEEMELSRLLGKLLETIYTQGCDSKETQLEEPSPSNDAELSASMLQLGFSHSVHLLISDLLRGRVTLDEASADLHQMLLEPRSFLYGRYCCGEPLPLKSTPHLHSKGKLYGRDRETRCVGPDEFQANLFHFWLTIISSSLITDTFCRISSRGTSEALLIGGYSGSGATTPPPAAWPGLSLYFLPKNDHANTFAASSLFIIR